MPTIELYRVIVPVGDIDAAAAFYAQVLDSLGRRVSPGRHYFDCGATILACFDPGADGDGYPARPNQECVYLATDDLEATYAAVVAAEGHFDEGAEVHGDPASRIAIRPWGERSFYVRDPFGNPLCFVDRTTIFTGL